MRGNIRPVIERAPRQRAVKTVFIRGVALIAIGAWPGKD